MSTSNNGRRPALAAAFIKTLIFVAAWALPVQLLCGDAAPATNAPPSPAVASDLPVLKVEGNQLVANGHPVRLRGLNWGWYHLSGTRYSESDMRNLAQWGANVVRLAFSYYDLETEANPPTWREDGFKDFDDIAQWARANHVYVILDMHTVPGGQSPQPYCVGGKNLIWTDPVSQNRFIALWAEIARRYRDHPEIAAYELMNEPGSNEKTPKTLRQIDERAMAAIRAVDPGKIIVVGGDNGSGPENLVAAMKFPDKNILYTAHFYVGAGGNEDFVGDARQKPALSGTKDWMKIEKTFKAPAGSDHMSVTLRSTSNTGSAWFDDVEVTDDSGKVIQSDGFDQDPQDFHPEAFPETMSFDPSVGHDKPGSLKEHASTEFNDWAGWVGRRIPVQSGHAYHISVWMKLDQATGETFLDTGFFRTNTVLDHEAFKKTILPAAKFARKYNVPVWIGEFGCDSSNPELQPKWVSACIALFEKNDMDWTYWSDRSTGSPGGMELQSEHSDGSDYPVNEALLAALRAGWALNRPF